MVIVKTQFGITFAYWMSGLIPDGDAVQELIVERARGPPDRYEHLRNRDRADREVRNAYLDLLRKDYRTLRPETPSPQLLLITNAQRSALGDPLLWSLQASDQDHIILTSDYDHRGEEFFRQVESDCGFRQKDFEQLDVAPRLEIWDAAGEPVERATPLQASALTSRLLLQRFVQIDQEPYLEACRYLEKLGFRID